MPARQWLSIEKALQIKPDFAEVHYNLGVALARQGRADEAIAHYEKALASQPDYPEAHNNLVPPGWPRPDRRGDRAIMRRR